MGRLIVFHRVDAELRRGLVKVCTTSELLEFKLKCVQRNRTPILLVKHNRPTGKDEKIITQQFKSPAAKIIDLVFNFDCNTVDLLAH